MNTGDLILCGAYRTPEVANRRYRDEMGIFKKVYFRTYLWKGVTGVMFTYIKKNRNLSNLPLVEYG